MGEGPCFGARFWRKVRGATAVVAVVAATAMVAGGLAGTPSASAAAKSPVLRPAAVSAGPKRSAVSGSALTPAMHTGFGAQLADMPPVHVFGGAQPGGKGLALTGSPVAEMLPSFLNIADSSSPTAVDQPALAFDSTHSQDVLFGGCVSGPSASCSSYSAATWTFNGDTWTNYTGTTHPSARTDASLVFDATTGTSILFGGENATGDLSDTWAWNGSSWTQCACSVHPSARHGAMGAYLPGITKNVLFGGSASGTLQSDTWTFNGTTWTQLSPTTTPAARVDGGLAYAGATAANLVLYGGSGATGDLGDTLTFNGTNWTSLSLSATPGPLERFGFAYDPTMHVPVLFDGTDAGVAQDTLFAWDGSQWITDVGSTTPTNYGSYPYGMGWAATPTNGQMISFGGMYDATDFQPETFKFDFLDLGHSPASTFLSHKLDDRETEAVNPADGNMVTQATDLKVAGVGIPLVIGHVRNQLQGCLSAFLGCGWTATLIDDSVHPEPDGSVSVYGIDDNLYYCAKSGSTYTCPAGSDMTYVPGVGGASTVTKLHAKLTYTFAGAQLSSVKDRNGNTITLSYTSGQLSSITDSQARSYPVVFNGSGCLDHIADPTGRKVTYGYATSCYTLTSVAISDPNDPTATATTSYADLGYGDIFDVTDPVGNQTRYQNTNGGRLGGIIRVTNTATGAGYTTSHDYYTTTGADIVTDANTNATTYTNDVTGADHTERIAKVTDPNGHQRDQTYDASNNNTAFNGNTISAVTTLAYDSYNNLLSTTAPPSATGQTPAATSSYYGSGATAANDVALSSIDTASNCTAYGYDTAFNLTTTTPGLVGTGTPKTCATGSGLGTLTNSYQGDPGVTSCGAKTGELCKTTDADGHVTAYSYDSHGNVTTITPPSPLGATTIVPDSLGRPASVTDGKSQKTTFTYDKADRITQILYNSTVTCDGPHATCSQYSYDADGNVTSRVTNIGTTGYGYDAQNNLTAKNLPSTALVDACSGHTGMVYTFDGVANLTGLCDAGGTVTYGYDTANALTSIQEPGGNCAAGPPVTGACTVLAYVSGGVFHDGKPTSVTYPPGTATVTSYGYDGANNQTSVSTAKSGTTIAAYTSSYAAGTTDKALVQSTVTSGTVPGTSTTGYGYDAQDRLCWSVAGTGTGTCAAPPTGAQTWAYDATGNRTSSKVGGTTTNYVYNAADELCATGASPTCASATYSYDADGNQTASPSISSLTYNSKNQTTGFTVSGTTTSLTYADADSAERVTSGADQYASSPLGVAEKLLSSVATYYTRTAAGTQIGERYSGSNYYDIPDGHGSTVAVIDATGTVKNSYSYDPYGVTTIGATTIPVDTAYTGSGKYNTSPKLYQFGTRFYDPATGRWTQQDPLSGAIQNPAAVNRYPYAGNNPTNNFDPSGRSVIGGVIDGAIAFAGGILVAVTFPEEVTAGAIVIAAVGTTLAFAAAVQAGCQFANLNCGF